MTERPANAKSTAADPIERRLKELESGVKRLQLITGGVGLFLSLVTGWIGWATWNEQTRVNVSIRIETMTLPNGRLIVNTIMKNDAKRQVDLSVLGVRLWKLDWIPEDDTLDQSDKLLFSDIRVVNCPNAVCGTAARSGNTRLYNWPLMFLAAGETDNARFGGYDVPAVDLAQGFWVEARVAPRQADRGTCTPSTAPASKGAYPGLCGASWANQWNCSGLCKIASDAIFVAPHPPRTAAP